MDKQTLSIKAWPLSTVCRMLWFHFADLTRAVNAVKGHGVVWLYC